MIDCVAIRTSLKSGFNAVTNFQPHAACLLFHRFMNWMFQQDDGHLKSTRQKVEDLRLLFCFINDYLKKFVIDLCTFNAVKSKNIGQILNGENLD